MDREVKYRVNKYILRLLVQHNIISKADAAIIQMQLLEEMNPPYKKFRRQKYRKMIFQNKKRRGLLHTFVYPQFEMCKSTALNNNANILLRISRKKKIGFLQGYTMIAV